MLGFFLSILFEFPSCNNLSKLSNSFHNEIIIINENTKNKMDKKKKNEEINPRLTFISCYPDCYSYRWVKITS